MRDHKLARVFGLAIVAALSLMAFSAASAQAGVFKVNGGAALLATMTGSQEGLGTILVPGRNLTAICHSGDFFGSEIISSTSMLLKYLFLQCLAFSHSKGTALPCTIDDFQLVGIFKPVLHNGMKYILGVPEGELFGTALFLGELCPLPEANPISSSVAAQVTTTNAVVNLIVFSKAIQELLGDLLKYSSVDAFIESKATLELTGAHAGMPIGFG